MIDKCTNCCRKHLRQSMITYIEALKGHPEKWDVSLGHLAEAADAVLLMNRDLALYYREAYLAYDADKEHVIDWAMLFQQLDDYLITLPGNQITP